MIKISYNAFVLIILTLSTACPKMNGTNGAVASKVDSECTSIAGQQKYVDGTCIPSPSPSHEVALVFEENSFRNTPLYKKIIRETMEKNANLTIVQTPTIHTKMLLIVYSKYTCDRINADSFQNLLDAEREKRTGLGGSYKIAFIQACNEHNPFSKPTEVEYDGIPVWIVKQTMHDGELDDHDLKSLYARIIKICAPKEIEEF